MSINCLKLLRHLFVLIMLLTGLMACALEPHRSAVNPSPTAASPVSDDPCFGPLLRKRETHTVSKLVQALAQVAEGERSCETLCAGAVAHPFGKASPEFEDFKVNQCLMSVDPTGEDRLNCMASYTIVSRNFIGGVGCDLPAV